MAMTLNAPAFKQDDQIPSKYTCEGEDVSPPLAWDGVPEGTKSLVLIIDDPDAPDPKAPQRVWVHWVDYNIPPETKGLPENASKAGLPQRRLHMLTQPNCDFCWSKQCPAVKTSLSWWDWPQEFWPLAS